MDQRAILVALKQLVRGDQLLKTVFSKYFSKEVCSKEDYQDIVQKLADLLWNENYTIKTAQLFSPLLLEILTHSSKFPDNNSSDSFAKHEWLCICLSKLIWNYPTVGRFAKVYFDKNRNLFWRYEGKEQPPKKKTKTEAVSPSPYQLLRAAYLFLIYDTPFFKELWSWSVIVPFLKHKDVRARWYAHQCLGRVGNIKNSDLYLILEDNFTEPEYAICAKEGLELSSLWNHKLYEPLPNELYAAAKLEDSAHDLTTQTVNVQNILLSKIQETESSKSTRIICVASVAESLYSLGLAISASEAVLLKGPVGCGKTSLVEYLANVTGRRVAENFFKVQLGDHMDSKMLLGTHCCTDIPGQFVWKPGVLVNAMVEGHWLLLEDIDCAPMDVISLLVPVLQSKTIVLPGHANPVKAAPGFQLFATQRLVSGMDGSYVEFKSNADIIDKEWRKIKVNPLNEIELRQIIRTKWPSLTVLASRILTIYSFFSPDINITLQCEGPASEPFDVDCSHGRMISMRDLFKFCGRIADNFDSTKSETVVNVYKSAIECFCDSIPTLRTRVLAAEAIAVKFNLPKSKAKLLLETFKPTIQHCDPVVVGRVSIPRKPQELSFRRPQMSVFAHSRQAMSLLEKVAVSIVHEEPVLLVGETGTGKTSIVQHLSELINQKLVVINMSQQTDSMDLLGGYKPIELCHALQPIRDEFVELLSWYCDPARNEKFISHIDGVIRLKNYDELFSLMIPTSKTIMKHLLEKYPNSQEHLEMVGKWRSLREKIDCMKKQRQQSKTTLAFKFIEGALINAMRNGEWLLLDEINLAEAETLECLAGVLENDDNSLILLEKGDNEPVKRHPGFRIFACMNPATDVGKKDLPAGIRSRFTEFFVEDVINPADLLILVQEYLRNLAVADSVLERVVKFYSFIREKAAKILNDGTGHHPHYSLRTLCRALKYVSSNPCHNVPRSLYEGFSLSFLSQLDGPSHAFVTKAITDILIDKRQMSVLRQSIPEPRNARYVPVSGYWILKGRKMVTIDESYIFTETVEQNLRDLARAVSSGSHPVLLQGETSCGKTSLINYLANATGNKVVRVNNHEHTDIQEYVGTYSSNDNGKLVFKEGVLVEAMRKGYWIILDELNLAPTEVMEALNRVLDDNRELFIAETQTLVRAETGFMIFATQNPPGQYGGRKVLSRAFRNRFIELHFTEIPPPELEIILAKKCGLSQTHSKKLVAVMHELQMRRRESVVFAGKQGFITLRDLFRWGERYKQKEQTTQFFDWDQHLADEGYLLLAGRVRHDEEMRVIQEVIRKHLKKDTDPHKLFDLHANTSEVSRDILVRCMGTAFSENFGNIVWTRNMRRLAVLVGKAMQFREPCLLVGNTGCGKTTMCQLFAEIFDQELLTVNCHMHTEASDFLGGLRPTRDPKKRETQLFEWQDGPLIRAMTEGCLFLADEISLADHSVLERLNSVLEPEQKLFLTEKTYSKRSSEIKAQLTFHFFATMNPGGDYGKKELSPALRNRFTEIWCPSDLSVESVKQVVSHNLHEALSSHYGERFGMMITHFMNFYSENVFTKWTSITLRDVLTWVEFINIMAEMGMNPTVAYLHGAFLVFLDCLGTGQTGFEDRKVMIDTKRSFFSFLGHQVRDLIELHGDIIALLIPDISVKFVQNVTIGATEDKTHFGIGPFLIEAGPYGIQEKVQNYVLHAKTTKANALRILRAMQLSKPVLLEGSPGVGKTSLIDALAKASGHKLIRINLSEQTDISDLFGADLPLEDGETGEFAWRDGPLLQALKEGHWILLDELNLASQSVLEGLNAVLDHRSEVFISELGQTIPVDKYSTRIFGCQNPHTEGGSRKGLPKSFLNRFTQVYVKQMETSDFQYILQMVHPQIPMPLMYKMLQFNHEIESQVNQQRLFGRQGAPFEFNLRDVFRWCEVSLHNLRDVSDIKLGEYVQLLYADRMRTKADKQKVFELYDKVMQAEPELESKHHVFKQPSQLQVFENSIQVGHSCILRAGRNIADTSMMAIATKQLTSLQSVMKCIEMNWMPILIGPSGSGKSSMVRLLAELSGHHLHVMSVNTEMDTIELLGGFEQVDFNRKIGFVANDLEPVVQRAISQCIHPSIVKAENNRLAEILDHMHSLSNVKRNTSLNIKIQSLRSLINVMEELKIPGTRLTLAKCSKIVKDLCERMNLGETPTGGQFEWVDSILIHAATAGHWLLIDDANFCSPSVLDRLNSLLEPQGTLTVSEQGVIGNDLRTIKPHPNFRIFLTMNPKNGEISRAMRNRGVEIFIEPIVSETMDFKSNLDVAAFAQSKGLVHSSVISQLYDVHDYLVKNTLLEPPTVTDFLSAATLYVQLQQNHMDPKSAFRKVCRAVYDKFNLDQLSDKFLPEVTKDLTIPVTSLLPTSLDYRHNPAFASIKKQCAVFTYFLKQLRNYLIVKRQGLNVEEHFFPYPDIYLGQTSLKDRFFCIMNIMMESCSIESQKFLDIWLQYTLEYEIKHETQFIGLKELLQGCLQLKDVFMKQMKDPLVLQLLGIVGDIYSRCEFTEIRKNELLIDPRWMPTNYRQILFKVGESVTCKEKNPVEMFSSKIMDFGNKFNLLLLWKTWDFALTLDSKHPSLVSLMQTEKILRVLEKRLVNKEALRRIPHFLESIAKGLLELLRMEEWNCSDECYWQFRDAMVHYFTLKEICQQDVEFSSIETQFNSFILHFFWLTSKIRRLYLDPDAFPDSIKVPILDISTRLTCNDKTRKLRLKLVKKLKHPQGFNCKDIADIYANSLELYSVINLVTKLTSANVANVKVILSNRNDWMTRLTNTVELSVFGSLEGTPIFEFGRSQLKEVGDGLQFHGLITVNQEDTKYCPTKTGMLTANIPTKKMVAGIQVLPLLDYFFNLYSTELLHLIPENPILGFLADWLTKIGCEYLSVDPNILGNIQRRFKSRGKEMETLLAATLPMHTRQGFSSEGLRFLQYRLSENNSDPTATPLNFDTRFMWAKQAPILTYICASLFDKPSDAPLMCRSSLGSYAEKYGQLELVKRALWINYEKLTNPDCSIRLTAPVVIRSWFYKLLTSICLTCNHPASPEKMEVEEITKLFHEGEVYPLCETKGQNNILEIAFNSIRHMESEAKKGLNCPNLMFATAKSFVTVGLLTTMFCLPRDDIDPAVKRNLKAEDCERKYQNAKTEKALRDWIYQVTNGQTFQEMNSLLCIPYLNGLDLMYNSLKSKLGDLKKKLIARHNHKFEQLKETLEEYLLNVGSPDVIMEIICGLSNISEGNAAENKTLSYSYLQKAETIMENLRQLIATLNSRYRYYRDLTVPFIVGMEQIIYGLGLARQCVILKQLDQQLKIKNFERIADFLNQLVSFPYNSSRLGTVSLLLDGDNLVTLKSLLALGNPSSDVSGRLVYKLLKSAILEIINEVKVNSYLKENSTYEIMDYVKRAFNSLFSLWNTEELANKIRKETEESLYIHKVKHHETEISEEEAIDRKLKSAFPSFSNEFADCMNSEPDPLNIKETPLESVQEDMVLSPEDIFEVFKLHATVMSAILPTEMKNSDENMEWIVDNSKDLDAATPYLLRYEVVCEIVKSIPDQLDGVLDNKLVAGNLIMCNELQKKTKINDRTYNIYHDPNPDEVLKIFPVLNKIEAHLQELLIEFPEHAQLVQSLKLVQRVLSFPVTDPLMKFVIGMELLLESIELWNQMAHSKISLKFESNELTEKIIECRSMELNGWRNGLDSVLRKQYKNSSKWFFHIYNLFAQIFGTSKVEVEYQSVMKTLKQFLEESPLSEFPARLSILHTFLQQEKFSLSMHKSQDLSRYKKLAPIQNLYCYYEQFLPDIKNRIAQIRKPIEKEIKDYVKIARWNDINFYAVKQSVEKSHRFVVKHVKAFEDALNICAKQVFLLPSKKDSEASDVSQWTFNIDGKYFVSKDKLVKENFCDKKITWIGSVPRYNIRIRKISRKLALSLPVVGHINALNEFSGFVMESLQNIIIDSGKKMCTQSQEKKQGLLLIQKKKQMLSTLFKNLQSIGLSYGKGKIYASSKEGDDILNVSAFDVGDLQTLKRDSEFRELLLKSSQDTNHYFYKSTAQYALLRKSMESPCKDLTLDIFHRIQGYSGNLLSHVVSQREELVKTSQTIDEMGTFFNMLSDLQEGLGKGGNNAVILPPQDIVSKHEDLLTSLMIESTTLVSQFGALMKCAPPLANDMFSGLPNEVHKYCLPARNTAEWERITRSIAEYTKSLEKGIHTISAFPENPDKLITWKRFSRIVDDFKILAAAIHSVVGEVKLPEPVSTGKELANISMEIRKGLLDAFGTHDALAGMVGEPAKEQKESLVSVIQKLTREVLVVFRDLKKECLAVAGEDSSNDMCPENLFTTRITGYMKTFEEHLHFQKVLKLMLQLKKIVRHSSGTIERTRASDASLRLLANLAPFLNQYFQLAKVYFAASVGMHRTSCKFFSILLEIFNILATQGFCIPTELKEEAEKLGATKFEDIEAGGLGEGEGTKDVSDKIESEDQLEDTLKEGQEKEEKEDEPSDIKEEEQGIEMFDDFEGKSYNPEKGEEEAENDDENEEEPDLEKQMGDVDTEDPDKLDEKVWGSDSEDEDEEMNEDDGSGGMTQDRPSELVANDDLPKENDDRKNKDKGQQPEDQMQDSQTDEYQGDVPDPMIDAPQEEPEVVELPDDMEINDDDKGEKSDNEDTLEINYDETLESDGASDKEMDSEDEEGENNANEAEDEAEDLNNATSAEPAPEEDTAQGGEDEGKDLQLPTHTPTMEPQALPSGDNSKSSRDPVHDDTGMDWESGTQPPEDQHKEGQADTKDAYDQGTGHEGRTSSVRQKSAEDQKYQPKLKAPSEHRTLDNTKEDADIKHRPVADKQSQQKSLGSEDRDGEADVYEHVEKEEDGVAKAVDIATEEQAKIRPVYSQENGDSDSDVICLSSDEEVEVPANKEAPNTQGDTTRQDRRQRAGEIGDYQEDEVMEVNNGEVVRTQGASRGETTLHTQHDLWASLSQRRFQEQRCRVEYDLFRHFGTHASSDAIRLWGEYENLVANLSQELCEQLRLVLEPTKMAKLKGDYRTGKRLNMRKIIPYIASQFRKDKIWLRRTKPSKRQYQIMLAVDDSSSMSDNHSKQLAFESLAVLGKSLSLLEAGELSVVSFGENVRLLLGFNEQFSTSTGARVFQEFTFSQQKTRYKKLLEYATSAMVQARSKDSSQLLVILSDGRGVNNDGEAALREAVWKAKENNIFMVFVIIDSPLNKDSILDITCPSFKDNKVIRRSYIETFPFPFYIILRDISTLPVVLGEALRQWFELVTSTER